MKSNDSKFLVHQHWWLVYNNLAFKVLFFTGNTAATQEKQAEYPCSGDFEEEARKVNNVKAEIADSASTYVSNKMYALWGFEGLEWRKVRLDVKDKGTRMKILTPSKTARVKAGLTSWLKEKGCAPQWIEQETRKLNKYMSQACVYARKKLREESSLKRSLDFGEPPQKAKRNRLQKDNDGC